MPIVPKIIVQAQTDEGAVTYEERVVPADARSEQYLAQLVERLGWALLDAEAIEARGLGEPVDGLEDARRRVIESHAFGPGGRRARGRRASLLV